MEIARQRVVARQFRQVAPVGAVDLVVHHARERLARGHRHLEEELELPERLVEDVGEAVVLLGDAQRIVAERVEPFGIRCGDRLDVLARARTRPSSAPTEMPPLTTYLPKSPASYQPMRRIERVVAGPGLAVDRLGALGRQARHGEVALVARPAGPAEMARRAAVAVARDRLEDLDARARRIEIGERIDPQLIVEVGVDVEGKARIEIGGDGEVLADAR